MTPGWSWLTAAHSMRAFLMRFPPKERPVSYFSYKVPAFCLRPRRQYHQPSPQSLSPSSRPTSIISKSDGPRKLSCINPPVPVLLRIRSTTILYPRSSPSSLSSHLPPALAHAAYRHPRIGSLAPLAGHAPLRASHGALAGLRRLNGDIRLHEIQPSRSVSP